MILATWGKAFDRARESFDAKPFEWLFAGFTLAWGVALVHPIPTFTLSPSYRFFTVIATEEQWAWTCLVGGFLRSLILWINGHWFRSAALRCLASLSTTALWFAAMTAFAAAGTWTPGVGLYLICFLVEFRCMMNAGFEAGRSEVAEWSRVMTEESLATHSRSKLALLFLIGWTRGIKRDGARVS